MQECDRALPVTISFKLLYGLVIPRHAFLRADPTSSPHPVKSNHLGSDSQRPAKADHRKRTIDYLTRAEIDESFTQVVSALQF